MTGPVDVALTPAELFCVAQIGIMRRVKAIQQGRRERFTPDPRLTWQRHINGAFGEYVVAKVLQRFWVGQYAMVSTVGDVHGVEVRHTERADGRLILHPDDADDVPFVLVTGEAPSFRVHGWILGRDGKDRRCWTDPVGGRAAYFVPAAVLRPMTALAGDRR